MTKPCISKKGNVQESIKTFIDVNLQDCSLCKLQDSVSRMSLRIDMQSFVSTNSDWSQACNPPKKGKKIRIKKNKSFLHKLKHKVLLSQQWCKKCYYRQDSISWEEHI